MASAALGAAYRHLRDLFGGGSTLGLPDGQLLSRYASDRDGAAFEALVGRHGPMVLATCRAILKNEHDVEDAFQATFLVLASKAGSIRGGDALGGWLHRVACRSAVQASIRAKRRRRKEAEAQAMAPLVESPSRPVDDLGPLLHEEIDRLPESQRLPVVLCDLEGLTYEQAAQHLHWTEPTLRCRLARGRQKLRDRLTRRGITAPAVAILLAGSSALATVVPASLMRAAVSAATGGAASAGAALLTQTILRGMLMTKIKIASTAALAALGLATAGVIAAGAGQSDEPRPAMRPSASAAASTVAKETPPSGTRPGEWIEVRGVVLTPDGKPVEGASVRLSRVIGTIEPTPEATSGPGGRFAIAIPKSAREQASGFLDRYPGLLATAPGFAPGWVEGIFRGDAPREWSISLVEAGPPIEGRVVDLEGRPIAGVRATVKHLWYPEGGDLGPWLASTRAGGTRGIERALQYTEIKPPPTATTDAEGRFRLAGIGRERVASLLVTGPSVATETLYVMGRDEPEVRTVDKGWMEPRPFVVHAPRFQHASAPTKPIEGVIRDKDNGRPIAGVKIRANISREGDGTWIEGLEATSGAEGRYRLTGLPKAANYLMFTFPGEEIPYLNGTFVIPASSPGMEPIPFDIALKRGIVVRGRVTDKATGEPVRARIEVFALADNPFAKDYPENAEAYPSNHQSDADGRFRAVGLPGRAVFAIRADDSRYRGGVGAREIAGTPPEGDGPREIGTTRGPLQAQRYHSLTGIDLAPGAESATKDLQVDPGRSLRVTAVDPEGRPIGGTRIEGLGDIFQTPRVQESPDFEIHALDPSSPRRLTVAHEARKLIGSVFLKGDEAGPITVRLQPWGVLAGRIVDDEGRPRPGLFIYNRGGIPEKLVAEEGDLPGRWWGGDLVTGPDGRFRVERLIPGLKYSGSVSDIIQGSGDLFRDRVVAPGEVKDLGDLKVQPRQKK